jgi:hypothetical protein
MLWLSAIWWQGRACFHTAKTAVAGAGIPKNHKSSRFGSPAFPLIGAIAAFADCMKLQLF